MEYSLVGYADMLSDPGRVAAYAEALRRHVRAETCVLDLGAGFGFFSLLALQLGARRVYAIEPAPSAAVIPMLSAANGFEGRLVLYRSLSSAVSLPEPVSLLVTDVRGTLPTYQGSLKTILDARRRFLSPQGVLLPKRDVLMLAPIEDAEHYARVRRPWGAVGQGLRLDKVESLLVNNLVPARFGGAGFLARPASWASIDYRTMVSPDVSGRAELEADRAGVLHGFALWFEAEIDDGLSYSSAPGTGHTAYGQIFLPLAQPVELSKGDVVEIALEAHCLREYEYRWQTRVSRDGTLVASFSQSTFEGLPLDLDSLHRSADTHTPLLDERGRAERFVLGEFDGRRTLLEIAADLRSRHPAIVPEVEDARRFVAELSARFSARER